MADSTLAALTAATAATGGLYYGTQAGADRKFTMTAAGASLAEAANVAAQVAVLNALTSGGALGTPSSGDVSNCTGKGKVLQMVYATKTDTATGTSSTPSTIFSATITPTSASSRIIAIFSGGGVQVTSGYVGWVQIARGSTAVNIANAASSRTCTSLAYVAANGAYGLTPVSLTVADEPATTSATTYNVQFSCEAGGTYYFNRSTGDVNAVGYPRTAASLILLEVAA